MAYYIFLKSMRTLEEFRKNPHVKIPPKSPSTNFQSLAIIKNQIFIQKEFFPQNSTQSAQRPAGPSGLSARPAPPPPPFSHRPRVRARLIPAYAALAYLPKVVSSLSLRSPATTPSPSVTTTRAPPIGFIVSPTPADPDRNSPAPPSLRRQSKPLTPPP
jgi:hypothetical protein